MSISTALTSIVQNVAISEKCAEKERNGSALGSMNGLKFATPVTVSILDYSTFRALATGGFRQYGALKRASLGSKGLEDLQVSSLRSMILVKTRH